MGSMFHFKREPRLQKFVMERLQMYTGWSVKIRLHPDIVEVEQISTCPRLYQEIMNLEEDFKRQDTSIFLELGSDRQFYDDPVNFLSKNLDSYDEMDYLFS